MPTASSGAETSIGFDRSQCFSFGGFGGLSGWTRVVGSIARDKSMKRAYGHVIYPESDRPFESPKDFAEEMLVRLPG